MGAYKRNREFGGKEQQEELRVREFREFGTASLQGITVCWCYSYNSYVETYDYLDRYLTFVLTWT